ncbi:IS110 family transposase [Archangium violaceum]|uniref:IS110 family transposase n=1 Tax=Archangium violaceum TaxID=83451 RepID=UPI002B2CAA30|nr:IS110 family transposase [Archangium violaceum]
MVRCTHVEGWGHEVVVKGTNFVPMYATRSRRVKTDKRDARTLAEACRLGAYRPAHRTSDEQRHRRAQLAVREALVRTRTRYISLVRALVRREGLRVADGEAESFVKRVEYLALPGKLKAEVAPLLSLLLQLNEQIAFLDGVLERLARRDEQLARLCTMDLLPK